MQNNIAENFYASHIDAYYIAKNVTYMPKISSMKLEKVQLREKDLGPAIIA